MSLPGTEAIRTLQRGARKAKRGADLLAGELTGLQGRILEVVERRGTALTALARHYLPSFDDRSLSSIFEDARRELEVLQLRQRVRIDELQQTIDSAQNRAIAHEHELEQINAELEVKVAERTRLQAQLAESLAADPRFRELTNAVAHATARLERDEERVAELRAEAKRKLPAYERSRLFTYLASRAYGSPGYLGRGFTRRMDRLVADLIDWPRAKAGYDFLRTTPPLVDAEVERRRQDFRTRMEEVESRERTAGEQLGLPSVMTAGEALGERRDALLHLLEVARSEELRAREELAAARSTTGQYHADALQKLRNYLDGLGTATLAARAGATSDPTDDKLVVAIDAADRELEQLRGRSADLSTQRESADRRATELQTLIDDLRRRECDSVRCGFELTTPSAFERRVDAVADGNEEVVVLRGDLERSMRFATPVIPRGLPAGMSSSAPNSGSGIPWWVLQAMGAVADLALRGAASRGFGRHFGSGGATTGSTRSGRSSTPRAPRSSPPASSGGGRFTRGSGF